MTIDFSALHSRTQQLPEFTTALSLKDIRETADHGIAVMRSVLVGLTDADVVFEPNDANANDPHAPAEDQHIGWSIAHLILHATASTEEYFATAAVLARGIAYPKEPRLRYEGDWREITTLAQCYQRIDEASRMRNGFLDTFPDVPHLDVMWERSERFIEIFGECNAFGAAVMGLSHEFGHHDQFKDARAQALAAREGTPASAD
jgi:hypothetical protein